MEARLRKSAEVVKIVAETLVVTTAAGAAIGGHLGGPEGAQLGAIVGLATGGAFLVYWFTVHTQAEDYEHFSLAVL